MSLVYESRFGLARGAVFKDGLPHLYAEGYEFDPSLAVLATRSVARLSAKTGGMAFLTLADGVEAVLDMPQEIFNSLTEGAALEIEIIAEARDGKRARARLIALRDGEPRRLSAPLSLKDRLCVRAVALGLTTEDGDDDLDAAEESALSPSGALAGGGSISIERTRALIACDVDSGGGEGVATPKAFAKSCNERAVSDIARRLRLSGLAGLVVIDLIGKRHDADKLRQLLLAGFGAEPVILAPIGKFGTLEFVRPWGAAPAMDAARSPVWAARRLLWQAAERASGQPGRLLTLRAPHGVLDIIRPLLASSLDPLAAILRLEAAAKPEVIVP